MVMLLLLVDKGESEPQPQDYFEGSNAAVDVSGSIIATTQTSERKKISEIVLYDGSHKLVFRKLNQLSTFVVPCFALLKIDVGVRVDGDQIIASHKFRPDDWFDSAYSKCETSGNNYRIRVFVAWNHARKFLPKYSVSEY